MKSIRPLYEAHGAEGYYQEHADTYENPHFPEIAALLQANAPRLDLQAVLDFSAGGGEVTRVLQELGYSDIIGSDPYTHALYTRKTGKPCLPLSFDDVIKKGIPGKYSAIISAFALHLCPPKDLYPLVYQLFQVAPQLVVLTPHKRPELENLPGVELLWADYVLTARGKQVRLKVYQFNHYSTI
jgi:hypothetical protein